MQHVKRNIDQSIRKRAREELPSYTMKNYLKNIRLMKSVQFVYNPCRYMEAKLPSKHVVARLFVVDVFMQ